MRLLRTITRLIGLAVVSFGSEGLWLVGWLPARALRRLEPWRRFILRNWGRSSCRVLGARVVVEGAAPSAPFLLVSNHLSYLDVMVYAGITGCVFVTRGDMERWPILGWLAGSTGSIFLNRELARDIVRTAEVVRERIDAGQGVMLFAEGTSTAGDSVLALRPSILEPAARHDLPVHHASIRYETGPGDPPARESVAWWGDMILVPHFLSLMTLRRIEARIVFGEAPLRDRDRKVLADRLHRAILERFVPMTEHPPPAGG